MADGGGCLDVWDAPEKPGSCALAPSVPAGPGDGEIVSLRRLWPEGGWGGGRVTADGCGCGRGRAYLTNRSRTRWRPSPLSAPARPLRAPARSVHSVRPSSPPCARPRGGQQRTRACLNLRALDPSASPPPPARSRGRSRSGTRAAAASRPGDARAHELIDRRFPTSAARLRCGWGPARCVACITRAANAPSREPAPAGRGVRLPADKRQLAPSSCQPPRDHPRAAPWCDVAWNHSARVSSNSLDALSGCARSAKASL